MLTITAAELRLVFAAFFTSSITAVFGLSGGVLLIGLMPGALPATAIIPVHGLVQFSSTVSRAYFCRRYIRWDMLRRFLPGVCLGTFLASRFVFSINTDFISMVSGVFILFIIWVPNLPIQKLPARFFSIGIIHMVCSGCWQGLPALSRQHFYPEKG